MVIQHEVIFVGKAYGKELFTQYILKLAEELVNTVDSTEFQQNLFPVCSCQTSSLLSQPIYFF